MVADIDLPYFRGYLRQRVRLIQLLDLLDIAAPEIGNAPTGKKNSNLWLQILENDIM